MSNGTASRALGRLASSGHLLNLSHNLWGLPDKISLLSLPPYLAAPYPCYISLKKKHQMTLAENIFLYSQLFWDGNKRAAVIAANALKMSVPI